MDVPYSKWVNKKNNHLHVRSLRIRYKDNYSSCVYLLAKDKSFTIHQINIQSLTIELFKLKRNLSKCENVQYFKNKNTDLQFTITYKFYKRLRQYTTLWPEFTTLLCFKGLEYDSFRNNEDKFSTKI